MMSRCTNSETVAAQVWVRHSVRCLDHSTPVTGWIPTVMANRELQDVVSLGSLCAFDRSTVPSTDEAEPIVRQVLSTSSDLVRLWTCLYRGPVAQETLWRPAPAGLPWGSNAPG
jgi:hypothetical protein